MTRKEVIGELQELKYLFERHYDKYPTCLQEAIDYIYQTPQWIPVSEGLPETDKEVFVYLWGDVPYLASVNEEGQWETDQFYLDADDAPKAWMQLPEPYKEEKE